MIKERPREITLTAILLGIVLSVVMGAANAYLGLKAGMTVSASIPAAVIAMGVLRGLLRRTSILESNLVQTAASAGESLAAGIIFTMPALILLEVWEGFDNWTAFWTTSLIALTGGLLGVLMMIPMRRVFVVNDPELKFPEGVACAEVLRAGSAGHSDDDDGEATGISLVVAGIAIGAITKFAGSYFSLVSNTVERAGRLGSRVFYFGCDISPALIAVGYIVGLSISFQVFLGGAIGWLITMPLLDGGTGQGSSLDAAWEIFDTRIKYMGVGAMVVGGVASIWKVRGGLVAAVGAMFSLIGRKDEQLKIDETERNLSGATIAVLGAICIALVAGIYYTLLKSPGITVLTTITMTVMSFFFAAVASYIVGLVGNSNSPVSGMTITAVLGTGLLMIAFGFGGEQGQLAMLGVAGVVCCVACTSGDVCNDLKTGLLVGASPRSQQIMQVLGVLVAAFVMAPVMAVLHQGSIRNGTGGIGGKELPAPQAGLFKSLAEGFFGQGELPLEMIAVGAGIGVALLLSDALLGHFKSTFRMHVMPVAVGMYLPFGLSVPILLGGLLAEAVRRSAGKRGETSLKRGVLVTSGVIAGESLIGVLLGFIAYMNFTSMELLPPSWSEAKDSGSVALLLVICALIYWLSLRGGRK